MKRERVIEQLELAERLLEEVDNVGLWVKSDDASDNWRKREALREADWAASDAQRASAGSPFETELRVLVTLLEPLSDMVTDTMGTNPALDDKIRSAQQQIQEILERVRST